MNEGKGEKREGPANRKFSFESNRESNQVVVVYVFNANCYRSCVGLLCNTDDQRCADSPGSSNNIARSLLQC